MTRAAHLLAVLALAACSAAPPDTGYRAAGSNISSIALFEQSQLSGDWLEVAGFNDAGCPQPGRVEIGNGGRDIAGARCFLPGGTIAGLEPSGPGRFRAGGLEIWVLWVDADNRTLVLGTPSGSFGAVLNRGGPIPADRLEAARRILAFNGYDIVRMVVP